MTDKINTDSTSITKSSTDSFKIYDNEYFNSKLHKVAYIINGNKLVDQIRNELKHCEKLLSIGELDNTIYATVLYGGSISYDKIPKEYINPLKIHEVYNWLCNLYLNDDVNNEYL